MRIFPPSKRLRAVFRLTLLGYEPLLQHFVDNPVLAGLLGREEIVTLGIPRDLLDRLAGMQRHQHVEPLAQAQYVLGMDFDVRSLTLETAERLMNHDVGIGQCEALALGTRRQQERGHRGSHADAQRRYVGLYELHRVVYSKAGRDRSARGIDVEMNVLVRVLGFQEQHLRDDKVGRRLVDGPDQEYDAFLQQARVDVVRALAASALLDHHRDQAQASRFFHEMWSRCKGEPARRPVVPVACRWMGKMGLRLPLVKRRPANGPSIARTRPAPRSLSRGRRSSRRRSARAPSLRNRAGARAFRNASAPPPRAARTSARFR